MRKIVILVIVIILNGCAALNSINNKEKLNDNHVVVAVDAKQRFIISKQILKDDGAGGLTNTGLIGSCVEPSPDVFAAISSAVEGSFNKAESISAIAKAVMSESAGTIGIRTEAIQLLRDAMFRLCEGYINGSITQASYENLHEKYQKSMVTLAAVGALADSARPVQMALTGQTSITRSELVKMLIEQSQVAKKILDSASAKYSTTEKEYNDNLNDVICKISVVKVDGVAKTIASDVTTIPVATPNRTISELCDPLPDGENKTQVVTQFCSLTTQAEFDKCVSFTEFNTKKEQANKVKSDAEEDIKRIDKDLHEAKTNDNLLVANSVSWSPRASSQPSSENIAKVAEVVKEL